MAHEYLFHQRPWRARQGWRWEAVVPEAEALPPGRGFQPDRATPAARSISTAYQWFPWNDPFVDEPVPPGRGFQPDRGSAKARAASTSYQWFPWNDPFVDVPLPPGAIVLGNRPRTHPPIAHLRAWQAHYLVPEIEALPEGDTWLPAMARGAPRASAMAYVSRLSMFVRPDGEPTVLPSGQRYLGGGGWDGGMFTHVRVR